MRFRNGIIALGFVTLALQFTGFPHAWKDGLYALVGLAVIALGYMGDRAEKPAEQKQEPKVEVPVGQTQ
jgi:hypothetical protein